MLHRLGDKPAIINKDGDQFWYKEGKLYRENKPAIILANGRREYYINGKCHREGGPAVIDHSKNIVIEEFWAEGEKIERR